MKDFLLQNEAGQILKAKAYEFQAGLYIIQYDKPKKRKMNQALTLPMPREVIEKAYKLKFVGQEKMKVKFARKCSDCGALMNEGYVVSGGEEYYCSDDCLHRHYTTEQWKEMYSFCGENYWTEWEDEDDYQYWEDGSEID